MKDSKGHGSNSHGSFPGGIDVPVEDVGKPQRTVPDQGKGYTGIDVPIEDDKSAADKLAGGHPKSAAVPVHSGMFNGGFFAGGLGRFRGSRK